MSSFRLFGSKAFPTKGEEFLKAVQEADKNKMEPLMKEKTFNVNTIDRDGNTGVHIALIQHCRTRAPESMKWIPIVNMLGKYKANFNLKNKSGFTPLDIAHVEHMNNNISIHMLKLLRFYGAK